MSMSDHVKGLGVLARKYGIPIYATARTIEGSEIYVLSGENSRRSCFIPSARTSDFLWEI